MYHTVILSSDDKGLKIAEEFVERYVESCHVEYNSAIITTAVMEAVKNAVQHGNGCISERSVELSIEINAEGFRFLVKDQGDGFNREDIHIDSQYLQSHRGLYLMESLSDGIVFSDGGSRVTLSFSMPGIHPVEAIKRSDILSHFFSTRVNSSSYTVHDLTN